MLEVRACFNASVSCYYKPLAPALPPPELTNRNSLARFGADAKKDAPAAQGPRWHRGLGYDAHHLRMAYG